MMYCYLFIIKTFPLIIIIMLLLLFLKITIFNKIMLSGTLLHGFSDFTHFHFYCPTPPTFPTFLTCAANPDQDFNTSLTTLIFSSTVSSQSINIAIIDDEIDEGDELFSGFFIFSTNPRVLLDSSSADILIQDNDGMCSSSIFTLTA